MTRPTLSSVTHVKPDKTIRSLPPVTSRPWWHRLYWPVWFACITAAGIALGWVMVAWSRLPSETVVTVLLSAFGDGLVGYGIRCGQVKR